MASVCPFPPSALRLTQAFIPPRPKQIKLQGSLARVSCRSSMNRADTPQVRGAEGQEAQTPAREASPDVTTGGKHLRVT